MSLERELAGLVERYELPARAQEQLAALTRLLISDPTAATAVREPRAVLDDHVADTLVALELAEVREAAMIADLGSGAGVPGLPLAIARPDAQVWLVESSARKCAFLARATSKCEVPNARVVNARAEAWKDGLGRHDLITARALGPLSLVAEYAAPLLRVGGSLVAWRGRREADQEAVAARAAAELGLEPSVPVPVRPYPGARDRHLHVMVKARPTPGQFPRRPGMARKRPLGMRTAV
jgi:16S rRNA (guanine527-N7)-methyltransferase